MFLVLFLQIFLKLFQTEVEFFDGATLIGEDTTAPYEFKVENLTFGVHGVYSKIYVNNEFNVTNIVNIQVGEQVPYLGSPILIPGVIEAGFYDAFEGGNGQNISYVDTSIGNNGDFRTDENIDAVSNNQEGAIVGWNAAGEWMEYSIDVQTAGIYDLSYRFASGNSSGGGPFYFEIEGNKISPNISVPNSNDWANWATTSVTDITLTKGKHILRLVIESGEFNLGKMTFTYKSSLSFVPPIASAGENISLTLPSSTTTLNGSLSNDPEGESISYNWEQVYGPSIISFDNNTDVSPMISNLVEGVYKCKLTVNDGTYADFDEVLVIVSETGNSSPSIAITSPTENQSFAQGSEIIIAASASDLDGTISKVEFYDGTTKLGEDSTSPYNYTWANASVGDHQIKAIVTDNDAGEGASQIVNITVVEVQVCSETSNEAQQGAFSIGFTAVFETVGTNVNITFELLDTNRSGVIAYLWKQNPFGETQMDNVGGLRFKKTLGGLNSGETITYGCKFAFAGGLAVTKYISYEVGSSCGSLSIVDESLDTQIVMYPNPVNNKLFIKSKSEDLIKVEIYSVFGNLVKSTTKNLNEINVEDLSSGLYLIKIFTLEGSISKKLIKI